MKASHIVLDEVHERNLQTDFLLIVVRDLLSQRCVCVSVCEDVCMKMLNYVYTCVCDVRMYVSVCACIILCSCTCMCVCVPMMITPFSPYHHTLPLPHHTLPLPPHPSITPCRPDVKVILMSATLNAEMFSSYFGE